MIQKSTQAFIDRFKLSVYDYISLAQSPAEVDMLRYLAFNHNADNSLIRLCHYINAWDFYHTIYDNDYDTPIEQVNKIANIFTRLKFENELSLTIDEKNLCPYHPLLNNLPPLISKDLQYFDFKGLNCFKITQAQPSLKLHYHNFTTTKNLQSQIHDLNQVNDRNQRLNHMVSVKRITAHDYFPQLNGQRGVFAKTFIHQGTIIDYYSGEYKKLPDSMPPMLCTWSVQKSSSWWNHYWKTRKIHHFDGWVDAYILGNMMKLVNSCYYNYQLHKDLGNIGCYYFHFKGRGLYVTMPVYVAIKDIPQGTELMTFYHVGDYRAKNIYGLG